MRKVLVTGSAGQLGRRLMAQVAEDAGTVEWVGLDRAGLDITDERAVEAAISAIKPDAIINCAAYTAVDRAEQEPERALAINAEGPGNLARAAAAHGVDLLHVSTDYVFDGELEAPLRPEHPTGPLGAYGASKRAGEEAVLAAGGRTWVVRIAWLYDPWGPNFLHTMVRLAESGRALRVVDDQHGTPTSAVAFARALRAWAEEPGRWAPGIWHFGHRGVTTWYGFARAIFEGLGLDVDASPCTTAEYPTPARRPRHSHLDPEPWFEAVGESPETWQAALAECLELVRQERRST